jgi:hypothetical protein
MVNLFRMMADLEWRGQRQAGSKSELKYRRTNYNIYGIEKW